MIKVGGSSGASSPVGAGREENRGPGEEEKGAGEGWRGKEEEQQGGGGGNIELSELDPNEARAVDGQGQGDKEGGKVGKVGFKEGGNGGVVGGTAA